MVVILFWEGKDLLFTHSYKVKIETYSILLLVLYYIVKENTRFFSIDLILPAALGPGIYSASNRNECQELTN
jgi:glucose uptake protein GlcU